jgi:hypothetical protein
MRPCESAGPFLGKAIVYIFSPNCFVFHVSFCQEILSLSLSLSLSPSLPLSPPVLSPGFFWKYMFKILVGFFFLIYLSPNPKKYLYKSSNWFTLGQVPYNHGGFLNFGGNFLSFGVLLYFLRAYPHIIDCSNQLSHLVQVTDITETPHKMSSTKEWTNLGEDYFILW